MNAGPAPAPPVCPTARLPWRAVGVFAVRNETKARIRALGYKGYRGYLHSEAWRSRRARYWKTHRRACYVCGTAAGLQLHHRCYDRIGGAELDSDLIPLCSAHHRAVHNYSRRRKVPVEIAHVLYKRSLARPRRTRKRTR